VGVTLGGLAHEYVKAGWRILLVHAPLEGRCSCGNTSCSSPGKHPRQKGWKDAIVQPDAFADAALHNIGIVTGSISGLVVIDVDAGGEETLAKLEREHGRLPSTVMARTGGGGRHLFFRHPGVPIKNDVKKRLGPGLDVRGEGGFVVAPPSLHTSGNSYEWLSGAAPWECELAGMPPWLLALLRKPNKPTPPAGARARAIGDARERGYSESAIADACSKVAAATEGARNATLNREAFGIGQLVGGGLLQRREAEEALGAAAARSGLPEPEIRKTLRSGLDDGEGEPRGMPDQQQGSHATRPTEVLDDEFQSPGVAGQFLAPAVLEELTDLGNAQRFVRYARGRFLFAHGWNRWLRYDGRRWEIDEKHEPHELAAVVARSFHADAAQAPDRKLQEALTKHALQSQKKERIEAMLSLAANAFPEIKVSPSELDCDPWLLNVENGTLDLRTAQLRPHKRTDKLTKLAPVIYDPAATAPIWQQFLSSVLPDDETRSFLQRAVGYSATGITTEHVVLFLFGAGRNGKSTLIDTLMAVLGDYCAVSPPELLLAKKAERHPTEMTTLVGRRLVSSVEAGQGKAWDEARVKWLTGGDRLTARGMRQDFFEFEPTHKFWVAANHRPRVRGTDAGIWSRLKEIDFIQEFRDEDDAAPSRQHLPVKDKSLKEKLKAEYSGILAWIAAGCLEWQKSGLGEPAAIRQATEEYRAEEDALRPFLEGYEPLQSSERVLLDAMASAYRDFAQSSGEEPISNRNLAAALRERGYVVVRGAKGKATVKRPFITGVRVTVEEADTGLNASRARAEQSYGNTITHPHPVTSSSTCEESEAT